MEQSVTEALGQFVARTSFADIPTEVLERAEVSLAHNFSVAMAGRRYETVAKAAARSFWSEPGEATLLADGSRVSVEGAAFANAAVMNIRSQDDTHPASISHPGTPVICAALAAAEITDASGAEFLAAVVLGYEVLGRIGRVCGPQVSGRGFRAAGVLGVFGATAAAAKLFRLSADETAHALGLAAHSAGGLSQVWEEGGAEFSQQLAFAARSGIVTARLAGIGATAVPHALEGKSGFFRAYADVTDAAAEVLAGLGESWQLSEVTVKPFPVCAVLQGPLQLAQALRKGHRLTPDSVAEVVLLLSPFEADFPGVDNSGPVRSPAAAKMSAQFCLSLLFRDGFVAFSALGELDDPDVRAFSQRVRVRPDAALEQRLCRLEITLESGETITGSVDRPVGRPGRDGITAFAESLAPETGMSANETRHLLHAIFQLRSAPGTGELIAACRAGA